MKGFGLVTATRQAGRSLILLGGVALILGIMPGAAFAQEAEEVEYLPKQ